MALIEGNDGPNTLSDTAGNDTIRAFENTDRVTVTNGRDFADGGGGTDTLVLSWGAASRDVDFYSFVV